MHKVLDKYGACSGGSRNISGNNKFSLALERTLADSHRKPAALSFTSGYNANDCALMVLGSYLSNCFLFSDASNHSSIIEGIRRSKAKKFVWKHNDLEDLEAKLAAVPEDVPKIICFESIYSMCGELLVVHTIPPLPLRNFFFIATFWLFVSAATVSALTQHKGL